MTRQFTWKILLGASLLLTACGHVISQEARQTASRGLSAGEVQRDPDSHLGEKALLGGLILDATPDENGTTLEILDYRLDHWGEPVDAGEGGVHFLARSKRPLTMQGFEPGRLVTLTATVVGREVSPSGPSLQNYPFPVFEIEEIYLWDTPFRYGTLHPDINAPVYVDPPGALRFSPYDPGYQAYPYTPYWYRP